MTRALPSTRFNCTVIHMVILTTFLLPHSPQPTNPRYHPTSHAATFLHLPLATSSTCSV